MKWSRKRREEQRCRRLGTSWPLSVRKKISRANKGQVPWILGKHHSEETKKKISLANKGKNTWSKGRKISDAQKRAISRANKGRKHTLATRRLLIEIRSKRIIPFTDTRPEKAVKEFLASHLFLFKQHGVIKNCSHQFDFVLKSLKILIEVDGCWWHGCRKCHQKISKDAKAQKARDLWWEKKAKEVGFRVVRIWEHDTRVGQFAVLCEALGLAQPQKEVPRGKGASIR